MSQVSVVLVTVGDPDEASTIARKLVEEGMVACVNIVPRIRSVYRWKGEICDEEEHLLIIKTRSSSFKALEGRVRQLHSYEVPEIISFPVEQGFQPYLDWVLENTKSNE